MSSETPRTSPALRVREAAHPLPVGSAHTDATATRTAGSSFGMIDLLTGGLEPRERAMESLSSDRGLTHAPSPSAGQTQRRVLEACYRARARPSHSPCEFLASLPPRAIVGSFVRS